MLSLSCLMLFKCCLHSGRPRLEWDRGWSVACRVDVWGWVNSGWNVNEIKQIKQVSSINDKFILVKLSIDMMAVEVIWDFYRFLFLVSRICRTWAGEVNQPAATCSIDSGCANQAKDANWTCRNPGLGDTTMWSDLLCNARYQLSISVAIQPFRFWEIRDLGRVTVQWSTSKTIQERSLISW